MPALSPDSDDFKRELREGESASGSVNTVTRHQNTVLRPAGPWTETVHHLLRYLESHSFPYAPRVLGFHASRQEQLSYLEGEVALRPWPSALLKIEALAVLGNTLKHYHHLIKDYRPEPHARWRNPHAKWQPGNIIRHGDLGPWNMVWQGPHFKGLIDWDFAEPGSILEDLAQLAWYSVPLTIPQKCKEAGIPPGAIQKQRLAQLCLSYGARPEQVIKALFALQKKEIQLTQKLGKQGIQPWTRFLQRGDIQAIQAETSWLKNQFAELV